MTAILVPPATFTAVMITAEAAHRDGHSVVAVVAVVETAILAAPTTVAVVVIIIEAALRDGLSVAAAVVIAILKHCSCCDYC